MKITIKEVADKKSLKTFIYLPEKIHQNHPNWVHPIYLDEFEFFNPQKNKAFGYCDTVMILAYNDEEVRGRAMGIINHKYNDKHNEKHVRFAYIETWDEPEIFHALIEFIGEWGKEKGMEKLVGPLAFTDKDPQGFLIEGFDKPMVIATNCNFPFMVNLTEKEGFTKKVDLMVYHIEIPEQEPPVYQKIYERFQNQKHNLKFLEFTSRKQVKPYIYPTLHLANLTFTEIYGFWPFEEKEMKDFANRYLYLINPRFIKLVVTEENEVIAFVIGMSNLGEGIQKARGRMLPFGFIHLLRAGKRSKQLNLLLGAIHPDYQGKGLDVIMGIKMFDSARKLGKTHIDSHLELEYNHKVRAEMERVGGKVYKKFRIYQKDL
ncbi:MAG: hypothetical protein JW833_00755 [Prolixibacteraceae bacterium]|nr:hypothetical protein [Prolixibacteraceae bacterium]